MIVVYVAGPYSTDSRGNSVDFVKALDNMREGLRLSVKLLLKGYIPFSPWLDYLFHFFLRPGEKLTKQHYYDYSMEYLRRSDCIFVRSKASFGVREEMRVAREHNKPIFYSVERLDEWRANGNK